MLVDWQVAVVRDAWLFPCSPFFQLCHPHRNTITFQGCKYAIKSFCAHKKKCDSLLYNVILCVCVREPHMHLSERPSFEMFSVALALQLICFGSK